MDPWSQLAGLAADMSFQCLLKGKVSEKQTVARPPVSNQLPGHLHIFLRPVTPMGDLFVYVNQSFRPTTLMWLESLSVNSWPFVRLGRFLHLHRLRQRVHGQIVVIYFLHLPAPHSTATRQAGFMPREASGVFDRVFEIRF